MRNCRLWLVALILVLSSGVTSRAEAAPVLLSESNNDQFYVAYYDWSGLSCTAAAPCKPATLSIPATYTKMDVWVAGWKLETAPPPAVLSIKEMGLSLGSRPLAADKIEVSFCSWLTDGAGAPKNLDAHVTFVVLGHKDKAKLTSGAPGCSGNGQCTNLSFSVPSGAPGTMVPVGVGLQQFMLTSMAAGGASVRDIGIEANATKDGSNVRIPLACHVFTNNGGGGDSGGPMQCQTQWLVLSSLPERAQANDIDFTFSGLTSDDEPRVTLPRPTGTFLAIADGQRGFQLAFQNGPHTTWAWRAGFLKAPDVGSDKITQVLDGFLGNQAGSSVNLPGDTFTFTVDAAMPYLK